MLEPRWRVPRGLRPRLARTVSTGSFGWILPVALTRARGLLFGGESEHHKEDDMLYWAAVFFVIALIAGLFGFFGIAAAAAGIAKILFIVFLVLAVVSLLLGRRATL
jgi:uncharacterized membrane protein YtjA (UPF0391 family)